MPKYVMLTLDLERGVSEENRQKFYAKLKELLWTKIPKVTTTWKCSWAESQSEDTIRRVVQNDLTAAAAQAGSPQYHAVAMIGDAPPATFTS